MASVYSAPQWVFAHELAGHVAMWAVRQSPYLVPENLEVVLRKFQEELDEVGDFDVAKEHKGGMRQFQSRRELRDLLEETLLTIPEVRAWNSPKIEDARAVEYMQTPSPDHDFIDLDALVSNIVLGIFPPEQADELSSASPEA